MFWTTRVSDEEVEFDFDDAEASIDVSDRKIEDYFNFINALKDGPSVDATVSFHIRWRGVKKRHKVRDAKERFQLRVIEDNATISWSAHEKGFKFVSDPASTSTTVFAEIARERNGAFFLDPDNGQD